jgi:thiamine-monophosphate kinase
MNEFELIARYFSRPVRHTVLGGGDDCALLAPSPGHELAVTTDMLVSGRHFFADADPEALGHKALAVNLSDLAAMGARPRWALLAGALPEADEGWLAAFSRGLYALAERYEVDLVGGDTTRGPRNLTLTLIGEVPTGRALLRSAAQAGDDVWVSGELGGANLALAHWRGEVALSPEELSACEARLDRPEPRVALGLALRGLAHAAIDVSDGLVGDLGHILERSGGAAVIDVAALPRGAALERLLPGSHRGLALRSMLGGGDDYELCFTAAPSARGDIQALAPTLALPLARIGRIEPGSGLSIRDEQGRPLQFEGGSFDHFAS